ncbi:hypothetical protein FQR65_LT14932 [Abscondita terminalis]|nr:hypothetical protein FQR65_LT14932 [Abscondita terminalis]
MRCLQGSNLILKYRILNRRFSTKPNVTVDYLDKDEDRGISILNLNRSERKNALSIGLLAELNAAIDNLKNHNVRVLIIRSKVLGTFCAGADLKERAKLSNKQVSQYNIEIRSTMNRIYNLPIPVLAAMDGHALGGGLEIALACDLRVAASNIRLGLVETRLAIIPGAGGTVRLPRLINPSLARELIYTAKVFDGTEAKEMGVVNHVVEPNDKQNSAYLKSLEIAREILPNGPVGVRMAKYAINRGLEVDIDAALAFEEAAYSQVIPTEDRIEGLKAFQEKRPPKYFGK